MTTLFASIKSNAKSVFVRKGDNVAYIDGIRALSCIAIFLYHSFFLYHLYTPFEHFAEFVKHTPLSLSWIWGLDKSVDAFFLISGFLIGGLLLKEHKQTKNINLKSFYWRRYLRLTPIYWFAMLVFFVLAPQHSSTLWANVLYINNFLSLEHMSMPWTWSLAVEEQFYLLFPPLLLWFILKGSNPLNRLLALYFLSYLVVAAVAYNSPLWHMDYEQQVSSAENIKLYFDMLYVNLYTRFGPLINGAIVAYLVMYRKTWVERWLSNTFWVNIITLCAIATIGLGMILNGNKHWFSGIPSFGPMMLIFDKNLFSLALSWIVLSCPSNAITAKVICRFLSAKIWYPFAQLSYSMYLFHYMILIPLLFVLVKYLKQNNLPHTPAEHEWFFVVFIVLLVVCVPFCFLTYLFIEKPFINMRSKAPVSLSAPSSVKTADTSAT
ncbi:MAG: acyltransferase [Pseudomonadales bacterium]|nr:acyltransferase [Pseudomonadales bacterium]